MKKINILMFLIIGILSLNLINAGTIISKPFLIKGEFKVPESTLGTIHPCDFPQAGDCRIFLYGPNDSTYNLFSNYSDLRDLTSAEIASKLSEGILTPPVAISTDASSIDFTLKIMEGPNDTELLSVVVTVPNPNASGIESSANILKITEGVCDEDNLGVVRLFPNGFFECKMVGHDDPGGPHADWEYISLGSGNDGAPNIAYFNTFLFTNCPEDGCYFNGTRIPPTNGQITLRPGSIDVNYISSNAITLDKLSQDVIDYIDSKEQVNNISNITEVTEVNMVDISDDSIGLNHLNQDLRNKIGSVQELPQDIYEDLSTIETIYYIVRDESTGSSYYIPVLKSTEFKLDAIRDLITYGEFDDSSYERNTSPGYSSVFPPTNSAKKYSDFIYPRTNRKYITAGKYIPIDITITDSGTQDYKITFYECDALYDISDHERLNHLVNDYYLDHCNEIQLNRIKGETINDTFNSSIIVSATANDGYSGRFHIKGSEEPNLKRVIYTQIVQTTDNEHTVSKISSGVVHIYPPITNIEHTGGYDQLCSVQQSGIPPFTQLYTYRIPDLHFEATGGSSGSADAGEQMYFRWNIDISAGDGEYHSVVMDKRDNKRTGVYNLTFTTNYFGNLNVIVWIKDTRTGQRFAKYFSIGPCTNQN